MAEKSPSESASPRPDSPSATGRSVEVLRTYLTLSPPAALRRSPPPGIDAHLREITACTVSEWRHLYATIGAPWHWHDRDAWPDATLAERLACPAVTIYRLELPAGDTTDTDAGFLELEHHEDGAVEIVYIGVRADLTGRGLGGWLLTAAVDQATALGATRVWLHTCTLDHPAALPNYLARGFVTERTERYTTTIEG